MAISAALPLEAALTASHRSRLYHDSRGPLYRPIMHQTIKFQQNQAKFSRFSGQF